MPANMLTHTQCIPLTPTPAISSERASSFLSFWRRIFKKETTEQHEAKTSDHNQPQIESESKDDDLNESEDDDLKESKDDDSSNALNSSAAEPTEPGSYRFGLYIYTVHNGDGYEGAMQVRTI